MSSIYVLQSSETGFIMWAGEATDPVDAIRQHYLDIGHPDHHTDSIRAMSNDEVATLGEWLTCIDVPEALYRMMGGDNLDGTCKRTINILHGFKAGRPVVTGLADFEPDQPNCAYVDVFAFGRAFRLQISRPRHASRIGESMEEGAAILTDEGHDDNADFAAACEAAGQDFRALAAYIIEESDAEVALDAAEAKAPARTC